MHSSSSTSIKSTVVNRKWHPLNGESLEPFYPLNEKIVNFKLMSHESWFTLVDMRKSKTYSLFCKKCLDFWAVRCSGEGSRILRVGLILTASLILTLQCFRLFMSVYRVTNKGWDLQGVFAKNNHLSLTLPLMRTKNCLNLKVKCVFMCRK